MGCGQSSAEESARSYSSELRMVVVLLILSVLTACGRPHPSGDAVIADLLRDFGYDPVVP